MEEKNMKIHLKAVGFKFTEKDLEELRNLPGVKEVKGLK